MVCKRYKTKDKKYIIYSITGTLDCINDFTVCKKAWKKIVLDLVELFKNDAVINDRRTYNHPADESGKSKVTEIRFEFNSGDRATVEMTDWSKKIGYYDNIRVNIDNCIKKMKEIDLELLKMFKNLEKEEFDFAKHRKDKTGKSKYITTMYYFSNEDRIGTQCYDWSKEMKRRDHLRVLMRRKELSEWLISGDAFK